MLLCYGLFLLSALKMTLASLHGHVQILSSLLPPLIHTQESRFTWQVRNARVRTAGTNTCFLFLTWYGFTPDFTFPSHFISVCHHGFPDIIAITLPPPDCFSFSVIAER